MTNHEGSDFRGVVSTALADDSVSYEFHVPRSSNYRGLAIGTTERFLQARHGRSMLSRFDNSACPQAKMFTRTIFREPILRVRKMVLGGARGRTIFYFSKMCPGPDFIRL